MIAPVTSNGVSRGGGSGSARPRISEPIANGTALAKTHGHGAIPRMKPPSVGASAAPAAELRGGIGRSDQRGRHTARRRRADRLRRADNQQERQALGEEAQQRRHGEEQLAPLVQPFEADAFAKASEGQQQHDQHQLVYSDDRDDRRAIYPKLARDRRQRDIGDAAVDNDQRSAEAQRGDGDVAAGKGQTVGGIGGRHALPLSMGANIVIPAKAGTCLLMSGMGPSFHGDGSIGRCVRR